MKRSIGFALLILALWTSIAQAQDAHVVQLSPRDAARAKALYDARQAATEAYARFTGEITKRYLDTRDGKPSPERIWWDGWRFDKTFHFIVPGAGAERTWTGTIVTLQPQSPIYTFPTIPTLPHNPCCCCCGTGTTLTTTLAVTSAGTGTTTACCACGSSIAW